MEKFACPLPETLYCVETTLKDNSWNLPKLPFSFLRRHEAEQWLRFCLTQPNVLTGEIVETKA